MAWHRERRRPATFSDDGDLATAALAPTLGPRLGPAATFATTEHFNVQPAP